MPRGRKITHGQGTPGHQTKEYHAWASMKRRCNKPLCHNYKLYGERGITYDPAWEKFENFFADMGISPAGSSLDRIDNNGDYCKENCRWATPKIQSNNRRTNRHITFQDRTQTLTAWAKEAKISVQLLRQRLDIYNWSMQEALTPAVKGRNQYRKKSESI